MRILACLLLSGALAAQSASFTPFGTGCAFNGQTPAIGNRGLPVLGTTFGITYSGPNFTFSPGQQIAHPFLVLGFGTLVTPVPAGLLPQQPAGCQGLITGDSVIPTSPDPANPGAYESLIGMAVPNTTSLAGLNFFAQWLTVIQQCGFAGCGYAAIVTSDAAVLQVGF